MKLLLTKSSVISHVPFKKSITLKNIYLKENTEAGTHRLQWKDSLEMWVGNVSTYSNKLTVSWDIVLLFLNTKLFPPPWGMNSEFWTCLFLSLMLFMFHLPAAIFPKSYTQWNGRMPTQAKQGFSLLFSNQNRTFRLCLCIIHYLLHFISSEQLLLEK